MTIFELKDRIPIFGGRWQPFHLGHFFILNEILKKYEKVIIGIVNPDPDNPPDINFEKFHSLSNPFYYWERVYSLTNLMKINGWYSKVRLIPMWHPRKVLDRENNYLPPPIKRFWYVPLTSEIEENKVNDLLKLGEKVITIDDIPNHILSYRATNIRRKIINNQSWDNLVPQCIQDYIEGLDKSKNRWVHSDSENFPILGGRWQPLHNGHLWAIKDTIEKYGKVVIGIVNPEPTTANWASYESFHPVHNPLSFFERLDMLIYTLKEEKLLDYCYIIPLWHPRESLVHEEAYLPRMRSWIIPKTTQHEYDKISDLAEKGENVIGIDVPPEYQDISSTRVKYLIYQGKKEWENLVPKVVANYMNNENHILIRIRSKINSFTDKFKNYNEKSLKERELFELTIKNRTQ